MIAVDSSALVAIALLEPECTRFADTIGRADEAWLTPTNYLETGMVLRQRKFVTDRTSFDQWLSDLDVSVRGDLSLHGSALEAFLAFGKGRHPARLNMADCFAYALAKTLGVPLLYTGDDFPQTDIRSAL